MKKKSNICIVYYDEFCAETLLKSESDSELELEAYDYIRKNGCYKTSYKDNLLKEIKNELYPDRGVIEAYYLEVTYNDEKEVVDVEKIVIGVIDPDKIYDFVKRRKKLAFISNLKYWFKRKIFGKNYYKH